MRIQLGAQRFTLSSIYGTEQTCEIGSSPPQTIGASIGMHMFSVNVASTNMAMPVRYVVRYKSDVVNIPAPTARIVTEGTYDPHMSLALPAGGLATTNFVSAAVVGSSSPNELLWNNAGVVDGFQYSSIQSNVISISSFINTIYERSVFVAREAELAKLDGFLEMALGGQARVVFVSGM